MKLARALTAGLCCFLLACTASKKPDKVTYTGRSYQQLFVFANTADIGVRVQFENDLAGAALAKGYTVVKSIAVFPPSFRDPRPPGIEQVMDSLKARGCDALFVVNLARKEDLKFQPGVKIKANDGMIGSILAGALRRNDNSTDVKEVNTPGSYTYQSGFYIKSDLADASSKLVVYNAVSEMMEYAKLNTDGKLYLAGLVDLLEKQQVLRK